MSDAQTKTVWRGQYCRVEKAIYGKPLGRPIRFQYGMTGWYLSVEDAETLAAEFTKAAAEARASRTTP